jgi:hypothetical protein
MTDPVSSNQWGIDEAFKTLESLTEGSSAAKGAMRFLRSQLSKPAHEREPPHCSTCGCGLAPEPEVTLVKGTCSICGKEFEGHPGDNACHPCWLGYDGMTSEELMGTAQPPAVINASNARQISGMCCTHGVAAIDDCVACRSAQPPVDVRIADCPACGKPMSEHKGELKPGAVLWCP